MTKYPKVREFALISYLDTYEDVQSVIDSKAKQIISYAYALHDKDVYEQDIYNRTTGELEHAKGDLKKPHFHIYLFLNERRYTNEITKWFMLTNKDGIIQNCLYSPLYARQSLFDYLTHSTENASYKYQYDDSIVVKYNLEVTSHIDNDTPADETFDILNDLLKGVSPLELVKLHGRDFLYHYNQYKSILESLKEI